MSVGGDIICLVVGTMTNAIVTGCVVDMYTKCCSGVCFGDATPMVGVSGVLGVGSCDTSVGCHDIFVVVTYCNFWL